MISEKCEFAHQTSLSVVDHMLNLALPCGKGVLWRYAPPSQSILPLEPDIGVSVVSSCQNFCRHLLCSKDMYGMELIASDGGGMSLRRSPRVRRDSVAFLGPSPTMIEVSLQWLGLVPHLSPCPTWLRLLSHRSGKPDRQAPLQNPLPRGRRLLHVKVQEEKPPVMAKV